MTTNYLRALYLGSELTDEEYEKIPYYRAELHHHVLNKGLQVGSILGMFVVGPLLGLWKGRSLSAMKKYAMKGGRIGCGIMIPFSPIMTELTIKNSDEDAIYDRSFRLRHNKNQLRADRYATYGGLASLGAFAALGACPISGFIAGVGVGTITSIFVSKNQK